MSPVSHLTASGVDYCPLMLCITFYLPFCYSNNGASQHICELIKFAELCLSQVLPLVRQLSMVMTLLLTLQRESRHRLKLWFPFKETMLFA